MFWYCEKIDEMIINKSILIYFKFVWINNELTNDFSKFDIVFVNELTIFNFENFEFVIYSIKIVETFRFAYFLNDFINLLDENCI